VPPVILTALGSSPKVTATKIAATASQSLGPVWRVGFSFRCRAWRYPR
jgi:hypothetical protein